MPGHHRQQQAVFGRREHARVRAGFGLVEHAGRHAPAHQVEALALGHLEPGPLELVDQLAGAVFDLVVVVHRLVRAQAPRRPFGVSRQNQPPGASTR